MATRKNKPYTDDEKSLVAYLKEKLAQRGVKKLPRDWHLKQLTTARRMLAGEDPPSVEQWKSCIDWLFKHKYWGDKIDHLARVEDLWVQYSLQKKSSAYSESENDDKRRALLKKLYLS